MYCGGGGSWPSRASGAAKWLVRKALASSGCTVNRQTLIGQPKLERSRHHQSHDQREQPPQQEHQQQRKLLLQQKCHEQLSHQQQQQSRNMKHYIQKQNLVELSVLSKGLRFCPVVDAQVCAILAENVERPIIRKTIQIIREGFANKVCPQLETLYNLISTLARQGRIDEIKELISIVGMISPEFLKQNCHFKLFVAEAMCKIGRGRDGVRLLGQIFAEFACMRKKIGNRFHYVATIFVDRRSDYELNELISLGWKHFQQFQSHKGLLNVWKVMFTSGNARYQVIADQITSELPKENFQMRSSILRRTPGLINQCRFLGDPDRCIRLFELHQSFKLFDHTAELVNLIIESACWANDLQTSKRYIDYAMDNNMQIDRCILNHYCTLLFAQKVEIPKRLLDLKHKNITSQPVTLKF